MEQISKILEIDSSFKQIDVNEDLYKLSDLKIESGWKYGLPTLVTSKNFSELKFNKNIKKFKKNFYKKYNFLTNISLDNLLIAGGSIRNIILKDSHDTDVDIFLYGIKDVKEANAKITKFIAEIYKNIIKIKEGFNTTINMSKEQKKEAHKDCEHLYEPGISNEIQACYNGNTISIVVNDVKIQFILRLYNTKSEILHGFDLGSSCVSFDGEDVWFTSLGKFCYENMVNIFDGTRRSTTYERRLIKYFEKGFSIILPDFDISKLDKKYFKYNLNEVCEMPYLVFSYSQIIGNKIVIDKFYSINKNTNEVSDYEYGEADNDNEYKIFYYNLGSLLRKDNKLIYHKCISEELQQFYDSYGDYDKWSIEFNSCILQYEYVENIYDSLLKDVKNNTINIKKISRYFNIISAEKFITNVLSKEINIEDLFEKQKEWVKTQLSEIINIDIKWITENPSSQLTSSINPIIEDNKLWYGSFYNKK